MSNWEKTEGQKGLEQAEETDQYFWTDTDGAHISSSGDHDTSGFHQLLTSVKNAFMHGTIELATFGENLIELGKNSASAVIRFCAGTGEIGVIDSMLTLFSDKVGVKGNSQAILASNGESNMAASKQNTTYTGLAQAALTAPSTDADPASALLQAKCTKNSDGSTVSESYISLMAKPDGTAPAMVKASEIAMNSSATTNPYVRVKTDSSFEINCPDDSNGSVRIGAYSTSTGIPIDSGITYIPHYGTADTPAAYLNVQQIQTPSKLIPITTFESQLTGGDVLYNWPGAFQLAHPASNYHRMLIQFGRDRKYATTELLDPDGKTAALFLAYSPTPAFRRIGMANLSISGTSFALADGCYSDNLSPFVELNTIFDVYKIVGF